ncbi:MAG TPA: hypothetical protein VHG32_13430 [Thermoanaerobaculia bacterium]|jgi:hypothetical protein|nr:hypothetical protein [Thermoanaerobaculia bacterium]
MKKKALAITLNRETLRQLDPHQAEKAFGGSDGGTAFGTCGQTMRTCGGTAI